MKGASLSSPTGRNHLAADLTSELWLRRDLSSPLAAQTPSSLSTNMAALRLSLIALLACFFGSASAFVAPGAALRATTLSQQPAAAAVTMMAKAPTKPMRVNQRNYLYNKNYRSEMRTRIKRVRACAQLARTPAPSPAVDMTRLLRMFPLLIW